MPNVDRPLPWPVVAPSSHPYPVSLSWEAAKPSESPADTVPHVFPQARAQAFSGLL